MPWSRPHRFVAFLMFTTMLTLGIALGVVVSRNSAGGDFSGAENQIITACITLVFVAIGFARQEYIVRKTKHDLVSGQNQIGLNAEVAANAANEAVQEQKKTSETIMKKLNGGIEHAIEKKLHDSAFPTTPEQLEAYIDRALDRAMQRGWKPPT